MLQSDAFFNFKSSVINYINEFINSYIKNSTNIKNSLLEIDENKAKYLMDMLVLYQEKIPKISDKFDYDKLRKLNYGKWRNINKWFISANGISEGERLLEATQNVIHKIYKYASSLIELHGNMINRTEEYKHICSLFDKVNNIEDANKLAMVIFGNFNVSHYKFAPSVNTDSLIKSYDVDPIEILVEPSIKEYKNTAVPSIIIDKTLEKKEIT